MPLLTSTRLWQYNPEDNILDSNAMRTSNQTEEFEHTKNSVALVRERTIPTE
jgi:hypothetical protein